MKMEVLSSHLFNYSPEPISVRNLTPILAWTIIHSNSDELDYFK